MSNEPVKPQEPMPVWYIESGRYLIGHGRTVAHLTPNGESRITEILAALNRTAPAQEWRMLEVDNDTLEDADQMMAGAGDWIPVPAHLRGKPVKLPGVFRRRVLADTPAREEQPNWRTAKRSLGKSSDIALPEPAKGFSVWIENGEWFTAPTIDDSKFGGHAYDGSGYDIGIRDCQCGCYMGSSSSSGPVDPGGPCPMNPWQPPVPASGQPTLEELARDAAEPLFMSIYGGTKYHEGDADHKALQRRRKEFQDVFAKFGRAVADQGRAEVEELQRQVEHWKQGFQNCLTDEKAARVMASQECHAKQKAWDDMEKLRAENERLTKELEEFKKTCGGLTAEQRFEDQMRVRDELLKAGHNFGLALTEDYAKHIVNEVIQLRADLTKVTAERDEMLRRIGANESAVERPVVG